MLCPRLDCILDSSSQLSRESSPLRPQVFTLLCESGFFCSLHFRKEKQGDENLTCFQFILGTVMVLFATWLYSGPDRKRGRPAPIHIVNFEKTVIAKTPRISSPNTTAGLLNPLDSAGLGLSTSRPATPLRHHSRVGSARGKRDE